jgi:hypothetical protein
MSGLLGSAQWMYASGAAVTQQSLKFNDDENPYLLRTPTTAGNRQTWSISMWVKRGNLGISQAQLFEAGTSGGSGSRLFWYLNSSDQIQLSSGTVNYGASGARSLRDPSAWYHILIQCSGGSIKHYINGELDITHSISGDTAVNSLVPHAIFSRADSTGTNSMDGYVAQVALFDGTAYITADVTNTENGVLTVKSDLSGLTFGTNGFHLTFQDDVVSEGFNAVTYRGTGASQSVSGLGLAADFVWIKGRNVAGSPLVYDSVRGATKYLQTNSTSGEGTGADSQTSFDSDGFSVGADSSTTGVNKSGDSFVAWAWDAGSGSAASNTDGSITSTVKANPSYGFSIVSYTGTGANATVGHSLGVQPSMIIVKNRDTSTWWDVYHSALGGTKYLRLNSTNGEFTGSVVWNNTNPTSSVFSVGTVNDVNASGEDYIAYCFAEVAGYSSIGSFTGNGSALNSITGLGFKPSFLLIKNASVSSSWYIFDNTRDTDDVADKYLRPNISNAEGVLEFCEFTADGFDITSSAAEWNGSGNTILYMAFADTREAAFWKDVSGQGNHWTPNNLDYRDSLIDSPANNFAVMNPLTGEGTAQEGNLKVAANDNRGFYSSFAMESGKWYWEAVMVSGQPLIGVIATELHVPNSVPNSSGQHTIFYYFDGRVFQNGALLSTEASFAAGDIIGVTYDANTYEIKLYKNNSFQRTITANNQYTYAPACTAGSVSAFWTFNFGQDSTFSGARPAGGNQDDNGIGDFAYPVPSGGYLALCTANLPTPTIVDGSEHFNTVLYTGTGSSNSIITGFQPDFTWIKSRSNSYDHQLVNSVVGYPNGTLLSNATDAEYTASPRVDSRDSNGFTVSTPAQVNLSSGTFASWNWKAGGTAVSNTDGSITSQVSANVDAGFSIVSWVHSSTTSTIGHGLTTAPNLIILKSRTTAYNWDVGSDDINYGAIECFLNSTAATSGTAYLEQHRTNIVSVYLCG